MSAVCEGVRTFLADLIEPAAPDTIKHKTASIDRLEDWEGKRVRVLDNGFDDVERIARRRVIKEYRVVVVCEQPYLEAALSTTDGPVPQAKIDQWLTWVKVNVYDPLNEAFVRKADGPLLLNALWTHTCMMEPPGYNPARLNQEKVFVSIIELAYREFAEG